MAATAIANVRTRKEWAAEINQAWQKSIDSILDVASRCHDAYTQLGRPEFDKMAETDLDFSPRVAHHFKDIGKNPALMDTRARASLPVKWRVLAELARLNPDDIAWAKKRGLITPETSLRSAHALVGAKQGTSDRPVGEHTAPTMLPSKDEANAIARETGKAVTASDGKIYTGTTDQEAEAYTDRRNRAYSVIDAINTLYTVACTVSPAEWMEQAETWWLQDLDELNIEQAAEWLRNLDTVRTDA